jgi:hypothetical protein
MNRINSKLLGGQNEKDKAKSDRDRNHRIDRSSGKIFQHPAGFAISIDSASQVRKTGSLFFYTGEYLKRHTMLAIRAGPSWKPSQLWN